MRERVDKKVPPQLPTVTSVRVNTSLVRIEPLRLDSRFQWNTGSFVLKECNTPD